MLIKLDNISKYFGSRLLFENISFEISEGEKIGFIGENGIGKTTLIKIMTGEISYDELYHALDQNTSFSACVSRGKHFV